MGLKCNPPPPRGKATCSDASPSDRRAPTEQSPSTRPPHEGWFTRGMFWSPVSPLHSPCREDGAAQGRTWLRSSEGPHGAITALRRAWVAVDTQCTAEQPPVCPLGRELKQILFQSNGLHLNDLCFHSFSENPKELAYFYDNESCRTPPAPELPGLPFHDLCLHHRLVREVAGRSPASGGQLLLKREGGFREQRGKYNFSKKKLIRGKVSVC